MKREQFLSKVEEMLPELNRMIMEKARRILSSGAIDLEDYEDDYILPKIFMSAMGEEIEFQYRPLNNKDRKTSKNLSSFL